MRVQISDVDKLVGNLDLERRDLANRLREIIKNAAPEVDEAVKWHQPTYSVDGRNLICIMIYRDHLNLGFFNGALLRSKLLHGTGKGLRHIKVRSEADINEREFERVIKESVEKR